MSGEVKLSQIKYKYNYVCLQFEMREQIILYSLSYILQSRQKNWQSTKEHMDIIIFYC